MTQTAIRTQEDRANALAILNDLLSESPSYTYEMAGAGKYERQLAVLVTIRKNGLVAAERSLMAVRARSDSELATLLSETQIPLEISAIPELPECARLPEGFLPRHDENNADWHESWDDSKLREVSPYLADYIHYSYQSSPEGYVDFHATCGVWTASTVAARRVHVELAKPMYTPIAAALVARTSLFAKTTTADAGTRLLKQAGLGWLLGDDETTPQKLLADMAGYVPPNYGDMDTERQLEVRRRLAMSGQVGWSYDEFNQLIDAMTRPGPMAEFAGLLRKLDNCPDEYKYSTRSHGQEVISKPYLPLLANTTPTNLRKHAGKGDGFWNDGFWARFVFITPPPNSFVTKTMKRGKIVPDATLSGALARWNIRLGVPACEIEEIIDDKDKPTGRYQVNREALPSTEVAINDQAYDAYERYRLALREMIASAKNQDLDGSYSRLADKALRIATLIASLENNNRIDLVIWTLAQEFAEMFRRNLHEFYSQVSCAQMEENPMEDILIEFFKSLEFKPVTVREILRQAPNQIRKLGSDQVEKLLTYLEKSGIVQAEKIGRKECYRLIQ